MISTLREPAPGKEKEKKNKLIKARQDFLVRVSQNQIVEEMVILLVLTYHFWSSKKIKERAQERQELGGRS